MAEETEGVSGGSITRILTKKVGGVPVYVYAIIGVLLVAWYLRRKQQSQAENNTGLSGDVTSQTFPYGSPIFNGSDIYITGTDSGTPSTTPPPNPTPDDGSVQAGWNLQNTIAAWNAHDPTLHLTWAKFKALNPDVLRNLNTWNNASGTDDSFIHAAKYRLR